MLQKALDLQVGKVQHWKKGTPLERTWQGDLSSAKDVINHNLNNNLTVKPETDE